MAVVAAGAAFAAPSNDSFESRELISGGTTWLVSKSGTTVGAEAWDEVDEKMEASPADHASVWFEWIAPGTVVREIRAGFSPGAISGLAAYIMPPGGTQISEMEPAGACIAPADTYPSIALAVQKGQRVILRVWTVKTPTVAGRSFSLSLAVLGPQFDQYVGSLNSAQSYAGAAGIFFMHYSTEVEDTRLESGRWAPASAAALLRWQVPAGVSHTWQLSLLPDNLVAGRCEILRRHPSQPGRYQPLVPPGTALQFTPVPGETIYIRASTTIPYHLIPPGYFSFMLHWPCEADERTTTALSLQAGSWIWANLFGATPSAAPLPVESAATLDMPDIWVRLTGLAAGDRFNVRFGHTGSDAKLQLYVELPDGTLEAVASAVASGPDMAFTALMDAEYFVRIVIPTFLLHDSEDYRNQLYLNKVTAGQPPNDEWGGAIVIQAPTPDPIRGDLRGATASAAEAHVLYGTPPVPIIIPRYRSVWYALDLPASPDLHAVSAWGNEVTLFTASANGVFTQLPAEPGQSLLPTYRPNGSRIYAMVQGDADRFLLMVTPATLAGDFSQNPILLTEGQPSRYFVNWASAEPDENLSSSVSNWHSWTAPTTGKYHFSTLESAVNYNYGFAIYAGPAPVTGPSLNFQSYSPSYPSKSTGRVLTFDATGGISYLIRTSGAKTGSGPAVLRVSAAEGSSPYTFWRQSFPAWDDALEDPLADPDGDGGCNLFELAAGQHPGFRSFLFNSVNKTLSPPGFSASFVLVSINRALLSGPAGCTPFLFTAEKSSDLQTWQSLGEISQVNVSAGDPMPYVRFRVSR